jgi:hypothetical protein
MKEYVHEKHEKHEKRFEPQRLRDAEMHLVTRME